MKKFAVFGNPVSHSLSPVIHQMFAQSCKLQIEYKKVEAPVNGFTEALESFFADVDVVGCNVTVPFKEQAYYLVAHCNAVAAMAQAVNTIKKNEDGKLEGYNTDGIGLVADLLANGASLKGQRILLVGAGGAARGVIHPLLNAGVAKIAIANRTHNKAKDIVEQVNHPRCIVLTQPEVADFTADIIINSTSASLTDSLPEVEAINFGEARIAYDMVYKANPTVFMQHARQQGARQAVDGLGMLVEQAAAAFTIWTGERPSTSDVIKSLRKDYLGASR